MERNIFVYEIEEDSAAKICQDIVAINDWDDLQEAEIKGFKREPIRIFINSYGGDVLETFAILGCMEMSKTPVHTIAMGKCMSCGLVLLVAGDERYALDGTTFMYHGLSSGGDGYLEKLSMEMQFSNSLQNRMDGIMKSRTLFKKSKLKKIQRQLKNYYFEVEKALEMGVIDGVIKAGEIKYANHR